MYLFYEQVVSHAGVKTLENLTVPVKATHVELQADTNDIRYTMDGVTPPTSSSGMVLLVTEPPKTFLIEDLRRIKFIADAAGVGNLNLHYLAGRDV